MTATAAREYKMLLAETAPQPIHKEAENEARIRKIEELAHTREDWVSLRES